LRRFFLVEKHDISKVSAAAIGSETETIGWDDCQFLAVADQLFRSSDAYLNLRRIAGKRLKDNPSHYMSLYVSIYGKRKEKDIGVLQKENKRALKALQQPQQVKQPEGVPARVVAEQNGVKEVKSNGVVGEAAREEINKEGGRDGETEPQRKQSHATPFVNPHLRNIQSSIFNLESSIEKMREQLTSFSSKNLSGGGVGSPNNKLAFLQRKPEEKEKEKEKGKESEKGKEKIAEEEQMNKENEKEKEEELQHPREEPVFERTYEAYCEAILDGAHPGDFLTLQALSDHFGVGINVISSIIEDGYVQILPMEITQKRELWLSNWQNIFFASLYPQRYGMPVFCCVLLPNYGNSFLLLFLASESDQPALYNFLGNTQKGQRKEGK